MFPRTVNGYVSADLADSRCYLKVMQMDRETLIQAAKAGPIRVTMNDGRVFDIPSIEFVTADDIAAHVVTKSADGRYRAKILSLVTMVSIESLEDSKA